MSRFRMLLQTEYPEAMSLRSSTRSVFVVTDRFRKYDSLQVRSRIVHTNVAHRVTSFVCAEPS